MKHKKTTVCLACGTIIESRADTRKRVNLIAYERWTHHIRVCKGKA